jgi:hypothetical protein
MVLDEGVLGFFESDVRGHTLRSVKSIFFFHEVLYLSDEVLVCGIEFIFCEQVLKVFC